LVAGPYLLDTSTMLWALADPARLSSTAVKALKTGPRLLSVVCYWEVVIKSQKGLLTISDPVSWWRRGVDLLGGGVLSIRSAHVTALAGLSDLHRDPFDRMLIAQAVADGLTVVTSDEQIRKYPVRSVW